MFKLQSCKRRQVNSQKKTKNFDIDLGRKKSIHIVCLNAILRRMIPQCEVQYLESHLQIDVENIQFLTYYTQIFTFICYKIEFFYLLYFWNEINFHQRTSKLISQSKSELIKIYFRKTVSYKTNFNDETTNFRHKHTVCRFFYNDQNICMIFTQFGKNTNEKYKRFAAKTM